MANGRASFTRGNVFAMNHQGATISITTDSSGDGTTAVTFAHKMNTAPNAVNLTPRQAVTTAVPYAASITTTGFVAGVDGCSATGQAVSFSYIAYDDTYK
jgi:short-subunit dehydrogenase involved in D-alanine esterification of teichoic acids